MSAIARPNLRRKPSQLPASVQKFLPDFHGLLGSQCAFKSMRRIVLELLASISTVLERTNIFEGSRRVA